MDHGGGAEAGRPQAAREYASESCRRTAAPSGEATDRNAQQSAVVWYGLVVVLRGLGLTLPMPTGILHDVPWSRLPRHRFLRG